MTTTTETETTTTAEKPATTEKAKPKKAKPNPVEVASANIKAKAKPAPAPTPAPTEGGVVTITVGALQEMLDQAAKKAVAQVGVLDLIATRTVNTTKAKPAKKAAKKAANKSAFQQARLLNRQVQKDKNAALKVAIANETGLSLEEVAEAWKEAHEYAREDQSEYKERFDEKFVELTGTTRFDRVA